MSKPKPKPRPAAAKKPAQKASKPATNATQKAVPKAAAKPAAKPAPAPAPKATSAKAAPAKAAAAKSDSAKLDSAKRGSAKPDSIKPDSGKLDPTASIMESAQHIWLAGLGAFGKAQIEGGKLFQGLVKEGSALEQKTRRIATGAASEVRGAAGNSVTQVRERTQETWDRLEQMFDTRVTAALAKLGVPSRKDIEELTRRVEELSKDMRKHSIGMGVKTGFSNVMTTTVRRARDELGDLARELEEAQLAAKQAGAKQPAKKAAGRK